MRFLAIFPVVLQHLAERFERNSPVNLHESVDFSFASFVLNRGFIGVYIFFVISGFILGLPFAASALRGGRKVNLKSYYVRRLTRLEPPYIIAMTIAALALLVMGMYSLSEMLPHYSASIFYLHNIIYRKWTFINPPVWTLEIEVQFYIMAPFLALFIFKIGHVLVRRISLVAFIVGIMLFQQYFDIQERYTNFTILGHLHYFLIGFFLADIYLNEWKTEIKKHVVFDFLSILAFVSLIYSWSWQFPLVNCIIFSFSLWLLFFSVFKSIWVNRFVTLPWITAIGGMCYSIYLIHLPITELFIRITGHLTFSNYYLVNYLIQLIMLIPVLLCLSIIFYLAIEKPCMYKDWPQRFKMFFLKRLA